MNHYYSRTILIIIYITYTKTLKFVPHRKRRNMVDYNFVAFSCLIKQLFVYSSPSIMSFKKSRQDTELNGV